MMRTWSERQADRTTKMMRRIHEDRAQHGNDHSCVCFFDAADRAYIGRIKARFADYPRSCSCWMCRNGKGEEPTRQQKRAAEREQAELRDWLREREQVSA